MPVPPAFLRRVVTIPALIVCSILSAALLAVIVVVTAPVSLLVRGRWRPVRFGSFLAAYLAADLAGVAAAAGIWLRHGRASSYDRARYEDLNFQLAERLLARLYRVARRLFGLHIELVSVAEAAVADAEMNAATHTAPGTATHTAPGTATHTAPGTAAHTERGTSPHTGPRIGPHAGRGIGPHAGRGTGAHAAAGGLPEPAPSVASGPVIVLSRHAGPGDAFLLVYGLLAYARRRPLIVLKHTLALDPWIDVILSRVPHCFIRPGGRGREDAAARIGDLAAGMGERDALVLFPEGGNFTPARRQRAIGGLWRRGNRKRAAQAAELEHVLPPRPAGVLSAISAASAADLAFVAHTGIDHLDSAAAVWRSTPLDRPLRLTWWRVAAGDMPTAPDARTDWLFAQWAQVDAWISTHRPSPDSPLR